VVTAEPLPGVRSGMRRRGDVLLGAIYAAVLDELADHGFTALSIERVAERAHTGKASIYRRWPSRLDLVLEALDHSMPVLQTLPDTGSTRDDLLVVLRHIADVMRSRCGDAARACFSPGASDELAAAIRQRLLPPRKAAMLEILRRGVGRGEVRADALTERVAELGPMLLHGEVTQRGHISDEAVVAIVDEILMPLLRP
jgi:AcrR family transcriptional regulator